MKRFPNKLSFSTQLIVLAANFVILMLKLLELLFSLRQLSLELLYLLFCIMLGYLQRVQLTLQRSESFWLLQPLLEPVLPLVDAVGSVFPSRR